MLCLSFWYATAIGDTMNCNRWSAVSRLLASLPGSGGQSISLRAMSSQGGKRQVPTDLAPLTRAAPLMTVGLYFKNVKLTSNMARCFLPIPLPYAVTEFKPFYDALSALYRG
jgi:hypothetical protein